MAKSSPSIKKYSEQTLIVSEHCPRTNPSTTFAAPLLSTPAHGLQLEGYELHGVLGAGGMGTVYLARQLRLGREVAVKVIRGHVVADRGDHQRFLFEAQAASRLDHPHIVPIYEIGECGGLPYYSMKLVDGQCLSERVGHFLNQPRRTAELMCKLAHAIHHAHVRGILHRDLKPGNILVDEAGEPHVTDFGLARAIEGNSELTAPGMFVGSPSYMSPEGASGKSSAITVLSDVWGLGTILYELLTGKPPFHGESTLETLLSIRQRPAVAPRHYAPRVDRSLETICMRCLEQNPDDRYPSARALAEDLEAYLRGETISADGKVSQRIVRLLLRESNDTAIMRLWGGVWTAQSLTLIAGGMALTLMRTHPPFHDKYYWVVLLAEAALMLLALWKFRIQRGPPPTHLERQLASIWCLFAVGFVLTCIIRIRLGLPPGRLLPVLALEAGLTFGCTAVLLGGTFYLLCITSMAMSLVLTALPVTAPISLAMVIGLGLLVPGVRHLRYH
jgi:hypothetical protein